LLNAVDRNLDSNAEDPLKVQEIELLLVKIVASTQQRKKIQWYLCIFFENVDTRGLPTKVFILR